MNNNVQQNVFQVKQCRDDEVMTASYIVVIYEFMYKLYEVKLYILFLDLSIQIDTFNLDIGNSVRGFTSDDIFKIQKA